MRGLRNSAYAVNLTYETYRHIYIHIYIYISREISIEHPQCGARFAHPISLRHYLQAHIWNPSTQGVPHVVLTCASGADDQSFDHLSGLSGYSPRHDQGCVTDDTCQLAPEYYRTNENKINKRTTLIFTDIIGRVKRTPH